MRIVYPPPNDWTSHCKGWVCQRKCGETRGTHNTVILLQGRGGSTTDPHRVLVNVNISLANEVLDLVEPRFQLPTLKDRMSGWGGKHTRRVSVVVKARLKAATLATVFGRAPRWPIPDWSRLIRSQLRSDDLSGRGKKR